MITHSVAAAPVARPAAASGGGDTPLPTRIGDFLVSKLGRAAMPVAMLAGGAAGAGIGMLTLGPIGALAGGVGGAWLGMLVVGLRP